MGMIFAYHLKLNVSGKEQVNEIPQKKLNNLFYIILTLRP